MPKQNYNLRFMHIADCHLGHKQYGLEQRLDDFNDAFKWACNEAIEKEVDFVIIAGDLFDSRTVSPYVMKQAIESLKKLKESNIKVFLIKGNHDRRYHREREGWLDFLQYPEELISYVYTDTFQEYKGCRLLSLGCKNKNHIEDKEGMKLIFDDSAFNIFILHAGVEGIIPNMGGCVSVEQLKELEHMCNYLALGHIHKPYEIDDWVFNPGSLEHWNISESDFEGGCYLVDVNTVTKQFKTRLVVSPKRKMVRLNFNHSQVVIMLEDCTPNVEDAIVELTISGSGIEKPPLDIYREKVNEIHPEMFYLKLVDKTTRPSSLNSEHSTKDRTVLEKEVIDELTKDDTLTNLVLEIKNRIDEEPEELLKVIINDI